jgi:hypothetical protein
VTLASLGITPGTYTYTVPSDTITLRFTPMSAVPLPGGLALLAGALGLIGLNRCRASARS